jgi:hypothetical protein
MARKARKKSAAKAKKTHRGQQEKAQGRGEKEVQGRGKKETARKAKPKTKPKPKGLIATLVADFKAAVDTLTDAERLHRKLEPHVSREPE